MTVKIMRQNAATIPEHSHQRKAAIARGGVKDYSGSVEVVPVSPFDLGRTIFNTLDGAVPRAIIEARIAKEVIWYATAADQVTKDYSQVAENKLPKISSKLMKFLKEDCDFDVEHADGSFLDHLYYCYEYSSHHFDDYSPLVMLLHSILGTGTNTFAMPASKINQLKPLMDDFTWRHVEAFPSVLRLLYSLNLLNDLIINQHELDNFSELHFHRVIDNEPITLSAEDFWIQLNYQLIHLTDFIPVSNWTAHKSDTSFTLFRKLFRFLKNNNKLMASIDYTPPPVLQLVKGEKLSPVSWALTMLPPVIAEFLSAESIRRFSNTIGHNLSYELHF